MHIDMQSSPNERFREFYQGYQDETGRHVYVEQVQKMSLEGLTSLIVNYDDLLRYDPELARLLRENPEEIMKAANDALFEVMKIEDPMYAASDEIFNARFSNIPDVVDLRQLRSVHLGNLISVEGIIIRQTVVKPLLVQGVFQCAHCGEVLYINQEGGIYKEPSRCVNPNCGKKGPFNLLSEESTYTDHQTVTIQEKPETLPPGQIPRNVPARLLGDLVDEVRAGDRATVSGILRMRRKKGQQRTDLATFDPWLEVNFVSSLQKEYMEIDIDPETEQQIIELSQDLNIHRRIIRSVAPSIYGMEIIKEALATVLFGGVYRVTPDGMKQRGESNILLIGDPGVAKSQLLQYVKLLAPRGLLTSGKASSAAGLTAAVVRDSETGEFSLEAGALVLADQGVCLAADTEILLSSGKVSTIEDIVEKGIKEEIISFNPNTFTLGSNRITNTSKRISDEIYKLEFSTGDVLKATKEHPLPTWDNGLVWKEVEELKTGDIIIDYRTYPFLETKDKDETKYPFSEELAELLGLIVTDGNLSKEKYKISFYSKSKELLERYKFLVEQVFDLQTKNYVDKRSMITRLYFDDKQIHTFLKNLGVPNIDKSKNPCIVPSVLNAPVKIIHAFLSGVINGDGSISNRKYGGIIDIVVGNKKTAIFYQKLLRKIGIVAQVNKTKQKGGGVVSIGDYTTHKVSITGVSNIRKFNPDKLMFHKKKDYQKIVKRQDKSDKVYKIDKIIQSLSSLIPHGNKSILYNNSIRKSQLKRLGLNKKIIKSALEELSKFDIVKQSSEYNLLSKVITNDVHFIKLKNKTKIESQTVYNLEIDKDNTFFGNFIPVHNCMIDEFDKMNPVDRSSIHEAMEQQVISIAKAGIVATLNARTAIIAAANPRFGRYEDSRPPADNINLPATILSRFDLIFVIRDEPNPDIDKKMARHILELRRGHVIETTEPVIPMDLLRKYISYSKQTLQPSLTDEAMERIEEYYLGLRKESDTSDAIAITPRYLEAIIRLSESQARMALKEEVTIDHVEAAINLLRTSLEQVGKDPVTGRVDIDYLLSGTTKSSRSKLQILIDIIQEESRKGTSDMVAIGRIKELAKEQNIEEDFVDRAINQLRSNGEIFSPREGFVKLA